MTTLSPPCANGTRETNDHTIFFDGLDRLIFPLCMRLFAPPHARIHLTTLADGDCADRAGFRSETNDHTIFFDGLDRLIFPLCMRLFAPPHARIHLTTLADGDCADRAGY